MLVFISLCDVKCCNVSGLIMINILTGFLGFIWYSEACPLLSEEEVAPCWCSCEPLLPRLPYPCELPAWMGCTRYLWINSFSCGTSGDMVLTSPPSGAVNTSSFNGLLQKGSDGRQALWKISSYECMPMQNYHHARGVARALLCGCWDVDFSFSAVWFKEKNCAATYVRTLWRPTMKATFLLQGLMKDDQLVSRVRYSPLWARIRRGEWSNGCPANWITDEERTKTRSKNSAAQIFTIELGLLPEWPTHFSCEWPP